MSAITSLMHLHIPKPLIAVAGLGGLAFALAACGYDNDPGGTTPEDFAKKIVDAYDKPGPGGAKDGVLNLTPPPSGLSSQDERLRLREQNSFGPELFGDDWVSTKKSQLVSNMALFTTADTTAPKGMVTVAEIAAVISRFDTNNDARLSSDEERAFTTAFPEQPEGPENVSRSEW